MKSKSINTVVVLAFLALCQPLAMSLFKENTRPNLVGLVLNDEKPELTASNWFSGSYQKGMDDYNNDHWAWKENMVRLNNQFYYAAFNKIRVNRFVIGKEDYVFSESYIFSAFGDDLLPDGSVEDLMAKAKVLQDTLKRKGIDLLFVYAPGKGSYCKEFIEDKYVHPIASTNHSRFLEASRKWGVNHLDLLTWFDQLKPASPFPLFPRFGHHWSYYGECLAVDTILKHIEHLHRCDLPAIVWDKIEVVDTARFRDADVLKSMNLYRNPPQNMKLAYPDIKFELDSSKNRTRVLTISDSYWYGPVYMGVPPSCFAGGEFWYYYNRIVPTPEDEKTEVWQIDLKKAIESNAVIMLLYSDGNLPTFGNGFIQDAYELYTSPATFKKRSETNQQIQTFAKQIRESPVLLKKSTLKSENLRISLDSAIKRDAMRMAGLINE